MHASPSKPKDLERTVRLLLSWRGPNGEFITPTVSFVTMVAKTKTITAFDAILAWKSPSGKKVSRRTLEDTLAVHTVVQNPSFDAYIRKWRRMTKRA